MKTNLLFVTRTSIFGGAEKHLVDLVLRLNTPNVHCTILCLEHDVFGDYLDAQPNIRVIRRGPFKSYWMLFAWLRPDSIVFVRGNMQVFPWQAFVAAKLSGARDLFLIDHILPDPPPPKLAGSGIRNYLRRLLGWRARQMWMCRVAGLLCDKTICVSNAVRDALVNDYKYPKNKAIVILNGIDLGYYGSDSEQPVQNSENKRGSDPDRPIIVSIASLYPRKRIDILLHAFWVIQKTHPLCRCIIVGSGPLEETLKRQAVDLGISPSVQFVGQVKDVRPYLKIADLFVLPSELEGLPLVLLEAMATGLPCVATEVAGNAEAVVHGHTGLMVKSGSVEQLAQAIGYMLVHREDRMRMARNAKNRVVEFFNIDNSVRQFKEVLLGKQ